MKTLGCATLALTLTLFSLGAAAAPVTNLVPPSCGLAYDAVRAGQLAEAAAKMAECGAASKPSPELTVLLYDRVKVLDQLGRQDEALAQLEALTDKAYFETGLTDEFSGPGVWSRDPEKVKARKALGISRTDLLLDIAWRHHRAKHYQAAIDWAERAARHAIVRYRPEAAFFPLDREAGCAIALRGMARFELDPQSGKLSWPDLSRGYIRGCTRLPVAKDIATLPEAIRKRLDALKASFDALQAETGRVSEILRQQEASAGSGSVAYGDLAFRLLSSTLDRKKTAEPVFKQRADFLVAETDTLGREPLSEIEVAP